jgi:ribonuclease T1
MQKNKIISGLLLFALMAALAFTFFGRQQHPRTHTAAPSNHQALPPPIKTQTSRTEPKRGGDIPQKVYEVLKYVKKHGEAPRGYVGGREFKNREHQLDSRSRSGSMIHYREWDVNPKQEGHNRGRERLVTGDDDRAWYSDDHYATFREVK